MSDDLEGQDRVIAEVRDPVEVRGRRQDENEGRYVLKRLLVTKRGVDGGVDEIELRSDNPTFEPIVLRAGDADIAVRAEYLDVLG